MLSILRESKKLGRLVAPGRIERSPGFIGSIAGKTERRQQLAVKFHCPLKIFHPQINVIQNSCFHFEVGLPHLTPLPPRGRGGREAAGEGYLDFLFSRRIINFNPDQISSTAQTFMSTNPSGNAISRITSSVTSVEMPEDFFGHETQIVPVLAIFARKIGNRFSNSDRCMLKK